MLELDAVGARERIALAFGLNGAEIVGNRAVIAGGVFKHFHRQIETGGVADRAVLRPHFAQHPRIVAGVHHDRDRRMILGRRPQHGRSANIDVFNGVRQGAIGLGDRGFKWIEVDHQQVDGRNTVLHHRRVVLTAPAQQTAVNPGMQGLEATVHHLREAGVIGDLNHGNAAVVQQLGGAAGGEQFHAQFMQGAGEVDDAGLVGNAEQSAADGRSRGQVHAGVEDLGRSEWKKAPE